MFNFSEKNFFANKSTKIFAVDPVPRPITMFDLIKVNASFAAASLALSKLIEISDTIHPLFKFCNNVSNSYYSQIRKNNLLDVNYFDNIRINAFGKRYYEPAPKRNVHFGLNLSF